MAKQKLTAESKEVQDFIKTKTWDKFFRYKLKEILYLPAIILFLWKVPLLIGWGFIRLFNINPLTHHLFCVDTDISETKIICDGINYNLNQIWSFGFAMLIVFGFFVLINWAIARDNSKREAEKEFGIQILKKKKRDRK